MFIQDEIMRHFADFDTVCKRHNISYLWAFGSSTTTLFDPQKSDIDLLVEIDEPDPLERGEKLISFWDKIEVFFQRKVDLLTEASIRNPFLQKNIDATKILIYDRKRPQIFV